ncbi:MAG: LysR substrate-binding domain-containing protein [Flavobacteriales bacterium]|nr:LysR substrate-binding domain-containing protein [Flavobacteriales bacterium]
MTITQLQYIMAVARYGSFTTAAEKCFVTQPTLSMQVQKLEEELSVQIFDRQKKPIALTAIGEKIISQATRVLSESTRIKDIIDTEKDSVTGDFRLGIIPSVMPTLLPIFLRTYMKKYPRVTLHIEEIQTEIMIDALHNGMIDAGIAATPLHEEGIKEQALYLEPMVAFIGSNSTLNTKKEITAEDISSHPLLILEKGHCFRNNVLNLCHDKQADGASQKFHLSSGNFDTLIALSKEGFGNTVIPYLNTLNLNEQDHSLIREFAHPTPSREISLIFPEDPLRSKIIESLASTIKAIIRGMIAYQDTKVISPLEN